MVYRMQVVSVEEAVPILLDRSRSPVVALDTEFDGDVPTCRSPLNGLSLAGGTPETGLVGCFVSYGPWGDDVPWRWLVDRLLMPILQDPERELVCHPPKVELQILHARGIPDAAIRCRIACTMSLVHVYDENLPKGLKDLAACCLGQHGAPSYAETQRELRGIAKAGEQASKAFLREAWEHYRDNRRKSREVEAVLDPQADGLHRLVMALPAGLARAAVEDRLGDRIRSVVQADFRARAKARFAAYGAHDALYTLALRYWLRARLAERPPARQAVDEYLIASETEICHPITTELEEAGLKIDCSLLGAIQQALAAAIQELRADVIARWGADLGDGGPSAASRLDRLQPPDDFGDPDEDGPGEEVFNPASTPQVVRIVWDVWGLRPPPWALQRGEIRPKWRRADGYCKVDKDVLGWLAEHAPDPHRTHIRRLLELRRCEKMKSSFVDPMLEMACADPDSRLHATFWPVGARTGRFSARDPAVETIPQPFTMPTIMIPAGADPAKPPAGVVLATVRGPDRKDRQAWRIESLRRVFVAPPGWRFLSVDLSQVENRMTAHATQDANLLAVFRTWDCAACGGHGETDQPLLTCPTCGAERGKRDKFHPDQPAKKGFCLGRDIHSFTAVKLGLFEKWGPEEGRDRSKKCNHAFTYAMGARTFAQREGLSIKDAERLLEDWHATYPGVRILQASVQQQVRDHGWVEMWDGARRRFPLQQLMLRAGCLAPWEWEGTIREAVNVLMQGGTGRWIKRAMPRIRARLRGHADPRVRETRSVNQVHDSLDYEVRQEVVADVRAIVRHEMENVAQLSVPILADGADGPTWADCK